MVGDIIWMKWQLPITQYKLVVTYRKALLFLLSQWGVCCPSLGLTCCNLQTYMVCPAKFWLSCPCPNSHGSPLVVHTCMCESGCNVTVSTQYPVFMALVKLAFLKDLQVDIFRPPKCHFCVKEQPKPTIVYCFLLNKLFCKQPLRTVSAVSPSSNQAATTASWL